MDESHNLTKYRVMHGFPQLNFPVPICNSLDLIAIKLIIMVHVNCVFGKLYVNPYSYQTKSITDSYLLPVHLFVQ